MRDWIWTNKRIPTLSLCLLYNINRPLSCTALYVTRDSKLSIFKCTVGAVRLRRREETKYHMLYICHLRSHMAHTRPRHNLTELRAVHKKRPTLCRLCHASCMAYFLSDFDAAHALERRAHPIVSARARRCAH